MTGTNEGREIQYDSLSHSYDTSIDDYMRDPEAQLNSVLDLEAKRLCVSNMDFDMHKPIDSRGSGSFTDFLQTTSSPDFSSSDEGETKRSNSQVELLFYEKDSQARTRAPFLETINALGVSQKSKKWRFLENDDLPSLNIVIMIVGTHGDVLPFIGFAQAMGALGHRIRIATHECHRGLVMKYDVEFYPLAGNPKVLSEFMVKTGGSIYGSAKNPKLVASNTRMVKEIIKSTWKACTEVNPDDNDRSPFVVDAIVSNPATMGHIHVAEALGVPLHIMFPQPWYYGTNEFAHPMLHSMASSKAIKNRANTKKKSFAAWEIIQYQVFGKSINKWRMKKMNLPPIYGSLMQNSIPKEDIPFSAMWSPNLLPRPKDWPEQCRVVGTFKFDQCKKKKFDYKAAGLEDFVNWLKSGPKPVFIGFGSMIIDNPERLQEIIKIAAAKVPCRVVVQSNWTKIDVSGCVQAQDIPHYVDFRGPMCFNVGSCPHDWLLPRCSAVIHHGGAGTTAAGLEHGLPTFICPFFGDQYLWAEAVHRASVGPKFCPVKDLNEEILINALKRLNDLKIRSNARKMAAAMAKENGIQGGMDHFMDFLPVDNMFCDVSMIMGEVKRARYVLPGSNLKVSVEVAALIEMGKKKRSLPMLQWLTDLGAFQMRRYAVTEYSISGGIHNILDGLYYGFVGFCFQLLIQAPYKLLHLPDKYAYRYGVCGCLLGCLVGPFGMFLKILYAVLYFLDCVLLGIVNGFSSPKNQRKYIINFVRRDNSYVYRLKNIELEREQIKRNGIGEDRFLVLLNALDVAFEARRIFNMSNPQKDPLLKITEVKGEDMSQYIDYMSFFNDEHRTIVRNTLTNIGSRPISFSHFCKILNSIVGEQIMTITDEGAMKLESNIDTEPIHGDIYTFPEYEDSILRESSYSRMIRNPVVRPIVKGVVSYSSFQKSDLDDSTTRGRHRTVSCELSPRRAPRGRTWSDGLANTIDKISYTVAGGRIRSNSPKARKSSGSARSPRPRA